MNDENTAGAQPARQTLGERMRQHARPDMARVLNRFHYQVVGPAGWGPQLVGRDWVGLASLPQQRVSTPVAQTLLAPTATAEALSPWGTCFSSGSSA